MGALYTERRAAYSLFSLQLSDADCEALRPYLFGRPIPRKAGDKPVTCLNLVDGEWRRTAELVPGAELLLVPDMGHDRPEPLWPALVAAITGLTSRS